MSRAAIKPAEAAIVRRAIEDIRAQLMGEATGHDWWHVERVYKTAVEIARLEKADIFIVSLAALLHDIADYKFHGGDADIGPATARRWLEKHHVEPDIITHICEIIAKTSFKGAKADLPDLTLEGKIVQDADRLDALGAIGIARAFAYGGYKGRAIHDPSAQPENHADFAGYQANQSTTINHFHEKLLLLKDRMHTETAKRMAQKRHDFMLLFLNTFHEEWASEDMAT